MLNELTARAIIVERTAEAKRRANAREQINLAKLASPPVESRMRMTVKWVRARSIFTFTVAS